MQNSITTELTETTEGETGILTGAIIGAAIEVHRALGPGLFESAYEACLMYELRLRCLQFEHQKTQAIFYKDVILDCGYRLDLVVEGQVIVEIKSVSNLLQYMKRSSCLI